MERRRSDLRRGLSAYKSYELLSGRVYLPTLGYNGCGNGTSDDLSVFISEDMKRDWSANRRQLLAVWRDEVDVYDALGDWRPWLYIDRDDELPWCERQFGEEIAKVPKATGRPSKNLTAQSKNKPSRQAAMPSGTLGSLTPSGPCQVHENDEGEP